MEKPRECGEGNSIQTAHKVHGRWSDDHHCIMRRPRLIKEVIPSLSALEQYVEMVGWIVLYAELGMFVVLCARAWLRPVVLAAFATINVMAVLRGAAAGYSLSGLLIFACAAYIGAIVEHADKEPHLPKDSLLTAVVCAIFGIIAGVYICLGQPISARALKWFGPVAAATLLLVSLARIAWTEAREQAQQANKTPPR